MRESKNFVEYRRSGYGQIRDRDPWFKEEITGKVRFNPTEGPKYTIGAHIISSTQLGVDETHKESY